MKPHTVEEDVESEINHTQSTEIAYYQVTVGAIVHDRFKVENVYLSHTFVTPGMRDHRRMRRAMCYFDKALFREGLHRHRLISNPYDTSKCTHALFKAMTDAYVHMSDVAFRLDQDASLFLVSLESATTTPIVVPTQPLVYNMASTLEPLDYHDLNVCTNCMRVEECEPGMTPSNEHVCVLCRR